MFPEPGHYTSTAGSNSTVEIPSFGTGNGDIVAILLGPVAYQGPVQLEALICGQSRVKLVLEARDPD